MTSWLAGLLFLAGAGQVPAFEQFRVTEKFAGRPANPILSTRTQRQFQTMIREAAQEGPNFAGHYTLAEWGCGAGCVSMAIADSRTGRVFDGPFNLLGYDLSYVYEGGEEQLEYRVDSRLIVARGCPGEKDCGTYYYEWVADRYNLVRRMPAKKVTG